MPLIPFDRIASMAGKCGTRIPPHLLEQAVNGTSQHAEVATRIAIEFIEHLRREGITQFHLYTLNRRDPAVAIISHVRELSEALT
jgi:methylenetetrahydrofolate reductase (NADPH)